MAKWVLTIPLGYVFHDEYMPFETRRDEIISRIRITTAPKFPDNSWLDGILEELADCDNLGDFDLSWDRMYDWADANHVWIDTFRKVTP